jgi:hypothetical protein
VARTRRRDGDRQYRALCRFVVERLQLKTPASRRPLRCRCNGRAIPLFTGMPGEFVAGVRFAREPRRRRRRSVSRRCCRDLVDVWSHRSLGASRITSATPADTTRRFGTQRSRSAWHAVLDLRPHAGNNRLAETRNPAYPSTLDLRWQPH